MENIFSSSIWRFGPLLFSQNIAINENNIEYSKFKFINFLGVTPDIATIDKKFINGVYLIHHLLTGTEVFIENISGTDIHLRNFKRKDAEKIKESLFA